MSYVVKSRYESYRESQGQTFHWPSITQQHFKEECDINNIIARYEQTGILTDPLQPGRNFEFGDYSAVQDYQDSLNFVIEARQMFDSLPSNLRERFNYDPARLLQFLGDENNRDEAVRLGLIDPPTPSPADPEPAPAGSPGNPAEAQPTVGTVAYLM